MSEPDSDPEAEALTLSDTLVVEDTDTDSDTDLVRGSVPPVLDSDPEGVRVTSADPVYDSLFDMISEKV